MLCEYLDKFALSYLDNIVIYSQTVEEHTSHVYLVLQKLQKVNLYVKLSKCTFDTEKINFLGFKVGQFGFAIVLSKVDTIATWPLLKTHCEVQMFLRFANFYCRFIQRFNKVAFCFSSLLKGGTNEKFKNVKFVITKESLESFDKLK